MRYNIILMGMACIFTSCVSVAVLSKKSSTVLTTADAETKIYVNDSLCGTGTSCKIQEALDGKGRQIRLDKEGYKSAYIALLQTKKRWAVWLDVPFSAAMAAGVWVATDNMENSAYKTWTRAGGIVLAFYSMSAWTFNPASHRYPATLDLTNVKFYKKLQRKPMERFVIIDNVAIDVSKKKNTYSRDKRKSKTAPKGLNIDNTVFTDALNTALLAGGYIDSTNSVLTNKNNGIVLRAKLIALNWHTLTGLLDVASEAKITMEWTVLDSYGQPLHSETIESESGQFIRIDENHFPLLVRNVLSDAVAHSLLLLFDKPEMQKYLQQEDPNKHLAAMQQLSIAKPSQTPKTIDEAMSACATVLVKAESGEGHGSGLFITRDGYLLTNYHVVAGAKSIEVQTHDGKKYAAQVIRSNQVYDLALIKIEATSEFAFELPSGKNYKIGADVFAIGTPSSKDLNQTLSKGIISGARKDDTGADVIQTDVSVNRGNSGGALIDKNAVLVGVVNAKLIGLGVEGVGFAIPAKDVLAALKLQY